MDGLPALPSIEWLLTIIQASINPKAVVFAILGTQALNGLIEDGAQRMDRACPLLLAGVLLVLSWVYR